MFTPVKPKFVRYGKAVYLSQDLPTWFGNHSPVIARAPGHTQTKGYVTSKGFEGGMLRVRLETVSGSENVRFNVDSAETYLECDPYWW